MSRRHHIPSVEEAVSLVDKLPGGGTFVTLEALQQQHDLERELACRELDKMAKQFAREDRERKKLWGTKFPRVLGENPPEKPKTINLVKSGKRENSANEA